MFHECDRIEIAEWRTDVPISFDGSVVEIGLFAEGIVEIKHSRLDSLNIYATYLSFLLSLSISPCGRDTAQGRRERERERGGSETLKGRGCRNRRHFILVQEGSDCYSTVPRLFHSFPSRLCSTLNLERSSGTTVSVFLRVQGRVIVKSQLYVR